MPGSIGRARAQHYAGGQVTGDIDIPHGERHDQRHHSGTAMVRVLGPIEVHTSYGSTIAFPTQKRDIIAAIAASAGKDRSACK